MQCLAQNRPSLCCCLPSAPTAAAELSMAQDQRGSGSVGSQAERGTGQESHQPPEPGFPESL